MNKKIIAWIVAAVLVLTGGGLGLYFGLRSPEAKPKIVISTVTGTGIPQGLEAVRQKYNEYHPEVEVVIELKPANGYSEWLSSEFSNPVADIVDISTAAANARSKVADYNEYMDEVSPYSGKAWKEQFNYAAQIPDPFANGLRSISLERVQIVWIYNKEIFEECGVTPPETWEQLIEVCQKLEARGYQPIGVGGTYDGFHSGSIGHLFQIYNDQVTRDVINIVRAQPGDYCYDPEVDGTWEYNPDDPYNDDSGYVTVNPVRLLKAISDGAYAADSPGSKFVTEQLARVFPAYAGGSNMYGVDYPHTQFYRGDVAMIIDGAYAVPRYYAELDKENAEIEKNPNYKPTMSGAEIGTFNMPSMEGEYVKAAARTIEVPVGFYGVIEKSKEQTERVMDFMMFLSSEEGYSIYQTAALANGAVPSGANLVYGVEIPEKYQQMYAQLESVGNCQKAPCQTIARGAANDIQASVREWYTYTKEFFDGTITIDVWAQKHRENVAKYFTDSLAAAGISQSDLEYPQNKPSGI